MGRVLIIAAIVMVTIYCVVEVAQADKYSVRAAPKWLWAFMVICVPILGPLAWLIWGRPGDGPHKTTRRTNPDDDPDFLRRISRR